MTAIGIDFGTLTNRIAFLAAGGILEPEFFQTLSFPSPFPMARRLLGPLEGRDFVGQWNSFLSLKGPAPNAAATLFHGLKAQVEKFTGRTVSQAVFSVPFCFADPERAGLERAVKADGLAVLEWIHDSTAALLAYGILKKKRGVFGIASMGAGYFEFCLARLPDGVLNIMARRSLPWGGQDINFEIAARFAKEMQDRAGEAGRNPAFTKKTFEEIEKAKLALSHRGSYDFEIVDSDKGTHFSKALSRYEFQEWIRGPLQKITDVCLEALGESGVAKEEIREIFLAGGASRTGFLQDALKNNFQRPLAAELNPELAVVFGTALRAEMLAGGIQQIRIVEYK